MKNIFKNRRGFTLIEMLVTVAVFAILISVSSSIFLNVNNLQQQTASMGKLQNEGRYVLEKMAREIRGRELDYDAMAGSIDSAGLTNKLIFKPDEFGEIYEIDYVSDAADLDYQSIKIIITDGSIAAAPLSAKEVIVEDLKFKLTPITDPYPLDIINPAGLEFEQPRVTIMMVIKNGAGVPEKYRQTLRLQTTISSKIYK